MKAAKRARKTRTSKRSSNRVMVGTRLSPEMKQKLDDAAARSGRSQAQEVEFRLEHSFERDDLVPLVLGVHFGRDLSALVYLLAKVMSHAGFTAIARRRIVANWWDDPYAFAEACRWANAVLDAARPEGTPIEPEPLGDLVKRLKGPPEVVKELMEAAEKDIDLKSVVSRALKETTWLDEAADKGVVFKRIKGRLK